MRQIAASVIVVLAMAPTLAFAQSAPTCERKPDVVCGPAKAAILGKTLGDVVVLTQTAVAGAKTGASLLDNDRVIARGGSSEINLGPDCLVTVPQKSSALVYRQDAARICVSVSDMQAPPVVTSATPSPVPALAAVAATGGAAAVVIAAPRGPKQPVSGQ